MNIIISFQDKEVNATKFFNMPPKKQNKIIDNFSKHKDQKTEKKWK